jgi:hypothetical protein
MLTIRRFEALCGLLAALLGGFALIFILFGPLYHFSGSSGASGSASLLQVGIEPVTVVIFCLLLLALIGEAVGAILHSRTARGSWLALLWGSTAVIGLVNLLSLLSIGVFLLPITLCALIACALSLSWERQRLREQRNSRAQ